MSKNAACVNPAQPSLRRTTAPWRRKLLCFALGAAILLGCSELYLLWRGIPLHDSNQYWQHPSYDPLLGWTNLPGHRQSYENELPTPVYETVWPDGQRATSPQRPIPQKRRILIVGCSYAYGLGVADEETWAWKVAQRFPQITFENFAVHAYGACQALTMAERQLSTPRHYDWVLYVAMRDHPRRDINPLHAVGDVNSTQPFVFGRRAALDRHGNLYFIPCAPRWCGDDLLRTINFAKRTYYYSQIHRALHPSLASSEYETEVFLAELKYLHQLVRAHGSRLAVLALEDQRWASKLHLPEQGGDFPFVCVGDDHCNQPDSPRFHDNGKPDGHPSSLVHAFWAKNIGDWLETQLADSSTN